MRRIGALLLGLTVVACTGEAEATNGQGATQDGLTLVASYPESFGMVRGVRELPGGAVLVADPLAKTLLKVDLAAGSAETVGSEGQGPDEYRQPDVVYPLPEGKSLLIDLGNARLTVLEPDLSFGETFPLASGRPGPGGDFQVRIPQAVDAQGRVYYRAQAMMMMGGGSPPTHAPVMRWDPWSDATEEVAQVQLPRREVNRSGAAGEQNVRIQQVPLTPEDGWAVGPDGSIAIARVDPGYRLDWARDGEVREGAEVAFDPVPIGTAEKEEWIEGSARRGGGIQISVEANNNDIRTTFSRGGGGNDASVNDYQWPEVKPPFEPGAVLVSPAGEAWVLRSAPAGAGVAYDVFDADGNVRTQIKFDGSRRVIGFGDKAVYVVRFDEYDLQYLEKYALN